jgi:hypothetical protein
MPLIKLGNHKLGNKIAVFSLPAQITCPGATTWCKNNCYARKGRYLFSKVKIGLLRSLEQTKQASFVENVVKELNDLIKKHGIKAVRIHASGDFYSQEYLDKWKEIALQLPQLKFAAWTKSWMLDFKNCPENITIFYSMVPDTEKVPSNIVRRAYVDYPELDPEIRRTGYYCPYHELKKGVCQKCGVCYSENPPEIVIFKKH